MHRHLLSREKALNIILRQPVETWTVRPLLFACVVLQCMLLQLTPYALTQGMSRPVLDAFYCFAFAVCRDPGKKHLQVRILPFHLTSLQMSLLLGVELRSCICMCCRQVDRAVALWRVVLRGRFRLLDRFCEFVASSPRLVINEDTWRQACRGPAHVCTDHGGLGSASLQPASVTRSSCLMLLQAVFLTSSPHPAKPSEKHLIASV